MKSKAEKFFEEWLSGEPLTQESIVEALEVFSLRERIEELESHVEHPMKPGYRRHDVIDRVKELREDVRGREREDN